MKPKRVSTRGQVVIPKKLREKLGIKAGDLIIWKGSRIVKVNITEVKNNANK